MLQHCQETNGILGGALFYNNKVVATQLNAELTKQLIITDPYRIKVILVINVIIRVFESECLYLQAPAETVGVGFDLPVGVQLLRVYIERRQLTRLKKEATIDRIHNSYLDSSTKKTMLKKVIQ